MILLFLKVVFFCMSIVNCAKCSALFAPKCSLRRSRGVRTASWVCACVALAASTMSGLCCAPDCTSTSNFQLFQYLCPRLHKHSQLVQDFGHTRLLPLAICLRMLQNKWNNYNIFFKLNNYFPFLKFPVLGLLIFKLYTSWAAPYFVVCESVRLWGIGNTWPNLHLFNIYRHKSPMLYPVPPSTKQYQLIMTQYHQVPYNQ